MLYRSICMLLIALFATSAQAQTVTENVRFKSPQGHMISVHKGAILVNGNHSNLISPDVVVYKSKRNQAIEDKGKVYMFLEVTDAGKKNKLRVYSVDNSITDSLLTAVASDLKDIDNDGYLEFGGFEAPVPHPSADSLYYNASRYYEIKKGKIVFDEEYTEKIDRKNNGMYIPQSLYKNGKPISIPKKKR